MAIKASRIDVWMTIIDDRAGGAAEKLEALAKAGADLEVVFARRTPEQPGQGILFAGPIEGAKVTRAAQEAGFKRSENIHGIRIEGSDKPGLGAKIARTVAESGISVRGINGMALTTYGLPCPVVAAITGHAIAGGFVLALCADYRIASLEGQYGLTEVKDDAAKALKALRKL